MLDATLETIPCAEERDAVVGALTAAALREHAGNVSAARTLLASSMGEWLDWINCVVRVVVPLANDGDRVRSTSWPEFPGVVGMSAADVLFVLESLVHEAAHQWLMATEKEADLVDAEDRALYWSPLRAQARPLRSILLAYHALAYMAAFYADGLAQGILPPGADRELAQVQALLPAYIESLDAAPGLTYAGRTFLEKTRMVADVAEA